MHARARVHRVEARKRALHRGTFEQTLKRHGADEPDEIVADEATDARAALGHAVQVAREQRLRVAPARTRPDFFHQRRDAREVGGIVEPEVHREALGSCQRSIASRSCACFADAGEPGRPNRLS